MCKLKKRFILIENKHLKSLPASCRHSFVVEKVELVVGRPFSRVYLAQSHVTMNISRDFWWSSWIEPGTFRPFLYFAPGGLFIIVVKLCVRNCIIYFLFSFYHFCFEFDMYFYCIKHNSFVFSETLINVIYVCGILYHFRVL